MFYTEVEHKRNLTFNFIAVSFQRENASNSKAHFCRALNFSDAGVGNLVVGWKKANWDSTVYECNPAWHLH